MARDNEQFARQHALAREYEKKMEARDQAIRAKIKSILTSSTPIFPNLYAAFDAQFTPMLLEGKYPVPSEIFQKEMPWIFDLVVYPRFREGFLYMADHIRDFAYSIRWGRRSFRSESFIPYEQRLCQMLTNLQDSHCLDADICDVLTGNLPEDTLAYLTTRKTRTAGFAPEMLAYELDRNNPRLEAIVTDIVGGENGFATVSWELIRGIVMSHNGRMHQLLCRLLVAAKLQEGLRQTICECADWGTKEAFLAILCTIRDHDLIRYSAVKRAVGTWTGLMTEETRDLDRISGKTLELICGCLADTQYRADCLASQDAMAIHIALWSAAFENAEEGFRLLDRIIREGTHHQVLTAGYFVADLESGPLRHNAARHVLKNRRDRLDILAVYLPSFLPDSHGIAVTITHGKAEPEAKQYFEDAEEARDFCQWLLSVFSAMKQKEQVFAPCIFPWHQAVLKKSVLLEKVMVMAAMMEDQEWIDRLCPWLPQCDADSRSLLLSLLTRGKKTPAVRKAILDGLQDKGTDTRRVAHILAKGLALTEEEYLKIEDMLRLRYEDLRRNCLDLLLKQEAAALEGSIRRLLASGKTQQRTAGLDLVTQLNKEEKTRALAQRCMGYVRAMEKTTTQEQVLIDALVPKQQAVLFTEEDRYLPRVALDSYAEDCIAAFMELFPDSQLARQVQAGEPVIHDAEKAPLIPCPTAVKAKENLKSLSDFFTAHETETFPHYTGQDRHIGGDFYYFSVYCGKFDSAPRMDLWQQWQEENHITLPQLYAMAVLADSQAPKCPYLARCGKYIADLYGRGFQEKITYRYSYHMVRIIHSLIREAGSEQLSQQVAAALGIWIARCLPEDMLMGDSGETVQSVIPQNIPEQIAAQIRVQIGGRAMGNTGHFIAHPQVSRLFHGLYREPDENLVHRLPILFNVYHRTFASTKAYMGALGLPSRGLSDRVLDQIYDKVAYLGAFSQKPTAATYLYAYHYGLMNERSLYYHLMEPEYFKQALELLTSLEAMEDGGISGRFLPHYGSNRISRTYERFLGEDPEQAWQLTQTCHKVAAVLVPPVVEAELRRGDTPTEYSAYVSGIEALTGMETFVRILSALGKDTLDRTVYYWGRSDSKRGNLSYLLARCAPAAGDDAQKLASLLKNTDITKKRLMEAALFSPAWIDIIGQYLGLPGFKSACYYFMAHMNEQFDEQKKAIIARFSPLSEEELHLGAFDVEWFRSAYEQLGEEAFNLIYDAAKYISDGNKHTRARKYADAALGRLAASATESTVKEKRNKDLLMAYGIIPLAGEEDLIRRYLYLQQFLKESKQFGAQRAASEKSAVEMALRNLATNAGFSDTMRLTLRMETKLVEDSRELFAEKAIGQWVFQLQVNDLGGAEILCFKDGKQLKSIPATVKKDPYVLRLQEMKKQLKEQHRRTRRMFEEAMEDGAVFRLEEMAQLAQNPVVAPMAAKLIFRSGEMLGLFAGGKLVGLDGNVLTDDPDAPLTVAHPFHLYQSGLWSDFQRYLYENRIQQPFKQVFRELYVKTAEELDCCESQRYSGHQIQPKKAAACLKDRRWVADIEAGLQKVYYQENIVATIYALADWFTPGDIEAPTLEYVAFYHRKTGEALKIRDIPEVIFSEVMRDVDMAVSVAHVGGVDPETSHSTTEMRAAILGFVLPMLRLDNVKIQGSHAIIDGKLARYSVHLGSGTVHQIGGTMLNVLPVHSQHRGRFFLPFVDDDPKTAEVISKVILFSEDKKLKDPTILDQIRREE